MVDGWQNKKCDGCGFCVDGRCRESPPLQIFVSNKGRCNIEYPVVKGKKACSKFSVWAAE